MTDPERIARELTGLRGTATPLPGEHDRNFRLDLEDGSRYVLKLLAPGVDRAVRDLQDAALRHLRGEGAPRLVASADGVRLLSWIEGRPWAQAPGDLAGLGRLVARTDRALAGFEHPAMRRRLLWNLLEAPAVARFAERLDAARRALVAPVFTRYESHVAPRLDALPHQVIHNDANEHNVLVASDGAVAGLIDFGDIVWAPRVCGLAVALAYAMQRHARPERDVVPVVRGYHEVTPLRADELAVLYDLARTRLAMSVCMAAHQSAGAPDNDYLRVSQAGVVEVLERLRDVDPDLAHFRFRDACGYEACPAARGVRQRLALGEASGLGGEVVRRYGAGHLGVDLALDEVRAPLDGVVEVRTEDALLLRHDALWTLWRDLRPDCGDAVRAGEPLGSGPVHLQLLAHPFGLAAPAETDEPDLWTSVCPDPNLLLARPEGDAARAPRADLRERRATVMSRALSLAYREPLHIVRGEGAHLYDAAGRPYLDLVNNVAHVGHCHPRVVAAGQAQMAALNTNTRYLHDSVVEYARRLAATFPDPLHVCFFVNSGSEANDLALRLAMAHTGRADVLVLEHAYHGHLSSTLALSPYKFGRDRPRTTHVCTLPYPYRGASREEALASVRAHLAYTPAALFVESLPGVGGQIVPPAGYLAAAFAAVREAGGVCVADEVQTGFGRAGDTFWAFELQGAVPDIVTLGKPMGNGHPIGAVVTTPEIAASFLTGMEYFNTFGGNPVSAEIGLAVLDVVADERLQANARKRGAELLAGLRELVTDGDVRGHGLFIGVELSGPGRAPAPEDAARVKEALKARGVLVSTDGPDENVLKIKPPLVLSREDVRRCLEAFGEVL